jgi:hypothetical protein
MKYEPIMVKVGTEVCVACVILHALRADARITIAKRVNHIFTLYAKQK